MKKAVGGEIGQAVRSFIRGGFGFRESIRQFRRALIVEALQESVNGNGRPNVCRTAKGLGIHRNTLMRLIVDLGIEVPRNYMPSKQGDRRRRIHLQP